MSIEGIEQKESERQSSKIEDLHKRWIDDPEYRTAYDELGPEFDLIRSVILSRMSAGLTQAQLAERMNTTQSAIARLEGGRTSPSIKTLLRIAQATGTRLKISFEPHTGNNM